MKRNDFWLFEKNEKYLLMLLFSLLCVCFMGRYVLNRPAISDKVVIGDSIALASVNKDFKGGKGQAVVKGDYNQSRKSVVFRKIELNVADSAQLEALPMIGAKLAIRILKYRDRLGGFYSIEQLKEVYGLRDTCFQVVQNRIFVDSSKLRLIHINTCALEELGHHPYIGFKNAKAILKYRNEHQRINNSQELLGIVGLHFDSGEKWRNYLTYQ